MKGVFAVLADQVVENKPFGETAVDLGFMTRRQVSHLLRKQRDRMPSVADCLVEMGAIDRETRERENRAVQACHTDAVISKNGSKVPC